MKVVLLMAGLMAAGVTGVTAARAGGTGPGVRAVVELFTSQGCSSCPPADALLKQLAARPDLVALAYHVDYWDYIGWTDTFGARANTEHQREYAAAWNSNRIYTPQMVINGTAGLVASHKTEVDDALGKASLTLPVVLTPEGNDMLEVAVRPDPALEEASVWLVTYVREAVVKVERGENTGKTIDYAHIVTGRQVIGMWDPASGAHLKLPLDQVLSKDSDGAAIVVQEDRQGLPGRILGAASYER